jgi:putative transposase
MMYETRVGRIDIDITTFWILAKMSRAATKLYNTALWNARDTWEKTGKIPSGFDLQKIVLQSPYHNVLPAHTYQHAAHQVWNGFKTWFKLRKTDITANPPGFRPKDTLSSLLFTDYGFKVITKNCFLLTLGTKLKEELNYKNKRLTIRVKWGTEFPEEYTIKELEIIPRDGYFDIHAKLMLPEPKWKTEGQLIFGDLGQYNPIVTEDENGIVDIFKGGKILSNLHYYNKEKARVLSEVTGRTNGKRKWSKALGSMSKRGTSQVQHSLHSLANKIVDICLARDVKKLVLGDLGGIKKEKDGTGKNWNKKSNQNWQQLPIRRFVTQLRYKLARHGIRM